MLIQDLMNEIVQGTNPAFNALRTSYEVVFIPVMTPTATGGRGVVTACGARTGGLINSRG